MASATHPATRITRAQIAREVFILPPPDSSRSVSTAKRAPSPKARTEGGPESGVSYQQGATEHVAGCDPHILIAPLARSVAHLNLGCQQKLAASGISDISPVCSSRSDGSLEFCARTILQQSGHPSRPLERPL